MASKLLGLLFLPLLFLILRATAAQVTTGMSANQNTTLYFGYGSNLWLQQMKQRCPTSRYMGVARLNGYRWMINERGYANVVETSPMPEKQSESNIPITNVSYGLVYTLESEDERRLDANEGVPIAYTKEYLSVDYWPAKEAGKAVNVTEKAAKKDMLVYINRRQTGDSEPKKEYIYRMNMGIKDAVAQGVPQAYVDKSMRPFIPDEDDATVREQAENQALLFEDER